MFTPTSPVVGSAITGFTSPTYTLTADIAPAANAKQFYVSALGGTQAGVRTHSISSPFTVAWFRDPVMKQLPAIGAQMQLPFVPVNKHRMVVRMGSLPLAGQPYRTAVCRVEFDIPAGSELADAAQLKAMMSFVSGILSGNTDGHYASITTGGL